MYQRGTLGLDVDLIVMSDSDEDLIGAVLYSGINAVALDDLTDTETLLGIVRFCLDDWPNNFDIGSSG